VPASGFIEPVAWHASLPGVVVAASGLIHDGDGRVLIVKPNYREHWTLPGGICEFGEAPHDGCARELAEELGVAVQPGRLLSVDWMLAQELYGPQARPVIYFIFDGGILTSLDGVTLQQEELDDARFVAEDEVGPYLLPAAVPRVLAAISARSAPGARYVPGESPEGSS
jgi:8-oxo-dGTP diphosphatase